MIRAFNLSDAAGGLIGDTTLIFSALGGMLAGTVADKMGRVRTLTLAIVVYSAFTALSGLATAFLELLVFRAAEGLGFGGEWAVGAVLIAETVRGPVRGRVLGFVQGVWAVGWALAVIAFIIIVPAAGVTPLANYVLY